MLGLTTSFTLRGLRGGTEDSAEGNEEKWSRHLHNNYLEVVGRGDEFLHLLASEDVSGSEVALGVTVLASLGGGHFDDLHYESWAVRSDVQKF